jgi:hypothetical protein
MVAGDHLDLNAGALAGADGPRGRRAGRVDHADEAEQGEALDVVALDRGLARGELAACEEEDAEAVGAEAIDLGRDSGAVDRVALASAEAVDAARQQGLGGALDQEDRRRSGAVVEGHHVHVLGREGDGVEAGPVEAEAGGLVGGDEEGGLGGVALDLDLVPAEDPGVVAEGAAAEREGEGGLGIDSGVGAFEGAGDRAGGVVADAGEGEGAVEGPEPGDGHLVLGEGAGLVGADDSGAAEGLDRGEAADQGAAAGHGGDADGEEDGDRGGEALGDRADGDGDGGVEGVDEVGALGGLEGEEGGGEAEDDPDEELGEAGDLAGERGGDLGGAGDHPGDPAGLGAIAGGDDDAHSCPKGHMGAGEGHAEAITDAGGGVDGDRALDGRDGLAGEGGLVDLEVADLDQAEVGGDGVARLEVDEVADDEGLGADTAAAAVAEHVGLGDDHRVEGSDRLLGAVLLEEADHSVDEDDGADDQGVDVVAEERGDDGGGDEDDDERLDELIEEAAEGGLTPAGGHPVGAVATEASGGLGRAEAVRGVAADGLERRRGGHGVPSSHGGYLPQAFRVSLEHGHALVLEERLQGHADLTLPRVDLE